LTVDELQQIAAAKFEEAASLPDGPQRQEILKSAYDSNLGGNEGLVIQRIAAAEIDTGGKSARFPLLL